MMNAWSRNRQFSKTFSPANTALKNLNPSVSSMSEILTLSLTRLEKTRFAPLMTKNVPSVTMKLGSPVLLTRNPFHHPTHPQRMNAAPIASHSGAPPSVKYLAMRAMVTPVAPVITPADRSNSPPIIKSATAIAMMPSGAATSRKFAVLPAVPNVSPLPQKKAHTTTVPIRAPISGDTRSRFIGPRYEMRSSLRVSESEPESDINPSPRRECEPCGVVILNDHPDAEHRASVIFEPFG